MASTDLNYYTVGLFGNQLHIIAATFVQSLRMQEPCRIALSSPHVTDRGSPSSYPYPLHFWNPPELFVNWSIQIVQPEELDKSNMWTQPCWVGGTDTGSDGFAAMWDAEVEPIPQIPNLFLRGWFESAGYLKGYEQHVRHLYQVAGETIDCTGVHVRRTDFCDSWDIHPLLTVEWYKKAMAIAGGPWVICSDDPAWCRQQFPEAEVRNGSWWEDWKFLVHCKRLVICNSTFSWWAAFMNPNRVIVAPYEWLKCIKDNRHKFVYGWTVL